MKTIVIAGGQRRTGKTTLAQALGRLLPDARLVKLGTHPPRSDKTVLCLPIDSTWAKVVLATGACSYLIIESGSILDDPALCPDLVIFLPAPADQIDKPGSDRRRARADLVRNQPIDRAAAQRIGERLELACNTLIALLGEVGVPVT